jgi:Ca2+-binding RTX toxin-like protein
VAINGEFSSTTSGYMIKTIVADNGSIDLSNSAGLIYSTPVTTGAAVASRNDLSTPDTVLGGAGADSLQGGPGNNVLTGYAGADVLYGLGGADTLNGGTGNDNLQGGTGNDTYIFGVGGGHDTITDTSGSNVLQIGSYHHYTDVGNHRVFYEDTTNTDWIQVNDYLLHTADWSIT